MLLSVLQNVQIHKRDMNDLHLLQVDWLIFVYYKMFGRRK